MGEVIKVDNFTICSICKKRKATILCDMPTSRVHNLHLRNDDNSTDYKNSFKQYTETCDSPVCEKCALEVGGDIHFCKLCADKLKGKL